jgi:two-component system sensor histidine kinase YesM
MESAQRTTGKNKFFHSIGFRLSASIGAVVATFSAALIIAAYLVFNNYTVSSARRQYQETANTVSANYDNYFSSVISVSNCIASLTYNLSDLTASKDSLVNEFDSIMAVKSDITGLALYQYDGKAYYLHDSTSRNVPTNVTGASWYQAALVNPTLNVFSRGAENVFMMSKVITFNKGEDSTVLLVTVSSVATSIYQLDLGTNGKIIIYDKDYHAVYLSSGTALEDAETTLLKQGVIGFSQVSFGGHNFILSQFTISNTTWRLAIFQNFDAVTQTLQRFIVTTILLIVGMIVASILVLFLVSRSVTKPISALRSSMEKVEEQGYQSYEPVPLTGSIETKDLARNYNEMILRIKTLNEDILAEQNAQRLAELHALQNQINPHFLYNTLDSIVFLIDDGQNKEASEMVVALSRFFRISISKGHNIISLSDEIEHVRNYLLIQKIRYKDSFEYSIDVPEDLLGLQVIKLILQPIVENAIQHGLLNREGVGKIAIKGQMEGDMLLLSVHDNGYGIMPYKVQDIYASFVDKNAYNGVGLKNVYQRLKIYFGDKADVRIDSELDEGTTVTLKIPVKERKINEE